MSFKLWYISQTIIRGKRNISRGKSINDKKSQVQKHQ